MGHLAAGLVQDGPQRHVHPFQMGQPSDEYIWGQYGQELIFKSLFHVGR